jgi:tetratricopeptide (TPR) repeat protein
MNHTPLVRTTCVIALVSMAGCARFQKAHNARVERRKAAQAQVYVGKTDADANAALARAKLLEGQGLDSVALAEFEKAISINPKMTTAYLGIGQIHKKRGNLDKAEQAYHSATQLEPTNFDAQYNHGLVLQLLNRVAEAVRSYLRALAIKPEDFDSNLNIATAYLQLGEAGPGLAYAQRAVRVNGKNGPARVNLGAIYSALGDYERAVVEYQQAAELMDLSPELLLNLADALGKTGRYAEMQNTLEQLIRIKPTATAHERLASALFRQQKYEEALVQFRKALTLDPDYYPALNGVGVSMLNKYLLSEKRDLEAREEALKALRRSLQVEHRQPQVVDLLNRYG